MFCLVLFSSLIFLLLYSHQVRSRPDKSEKKQGFSKANGKRHTKKWELVGKENNSLGKRRDLLNISEAAVTDTRRTQTRPTTLQDGEGQEARVVCISSSECLAYSPPGPKKEKEIQEFLVTDGSDQLIAGLTALLYLVVSWFHPRYSFYSPLSRLFEKKRSFIYSTTDVKKDKHKMHIVFFLSFFFFWNQEIVHQRMPDQGCLVSGALIHVVMYTLYLSLPSSSSSILHRTAMKTVSLVRAPQRESCRGQFGGGKKTGRSISI